MVNEHRTASVLRFYPQNVHQPWPLALKYCTIDVVVRLMQGGLVVSGMDEL